MGRIVHWMKYIWSFTLMLFIIPCGIMVSYGSWLHISSLGSIQRVKDILIICADGLSGIKETIAAAFPKTEYQRCIVHRVRNTLKYVPDKDWKVFATDLKNIYHAPDEKKALEALRRVTEKWTPKYPNAMKRREDTSSTLIIEDLYLQTFLHTLRKAVNI